MYRWNESRNRPRCADNFGTVPICGQVLCPVAAAASRWCRFCADSGHFPVWWQVRCRSCDKSWTRDRWTGRRSSIADASPLLESWKIGSRIISRPKPVIRVNTHSHVTAVRIDITGRLTANSVRGSFDLSDIKSLNHRWLFVTHKSLHIYSRKIGNCIENECVRYNSTYTTVL